MDIDQTTLRALAAIRDSAGVLSVYATADPREDAERPAWQVRVRNDLATIRERVGATVPREKRKTIHRRLDALAPDLDDLLRSSTPGLGRAMFVPLDDGETHTFTLQLPLPDIAVLDAFAYVGPLASAASIGAPAGVVAVARDGVQLVDIRYGMAADVLDLAFDLDTEDWRKMAGPAGHRAGGSQQNVLHTDRFERRVVAAVERLLRRAAAEVAAVAVDRGWQRIVVTGDLRLVEVLAAELARRTGREPERADQIVYGMPAERVADAVSQVLDRARRSAERALAARTRDAARSGPTAAAGLVDTVAALNDDRVAHLVIDPRTERRGHRATDGSLHPLDQVPPGREADGHVDDLSERMIERALAGGARVTVLDEDIADELADTDGVAALLRW